MEVTDVVTEHVKSSMPKLLPTILGVGVVASLGMSIAATVSVAEHGKKSLPLKGGSLTGPLSATIISASGAITGKVLATSGGANLDTVKTQTDYNTIHISHNSNTIIDNATVVTRQIEQLVLDVDKVKSTISTYTLQHIENTKEESVCNFQIRNNNFAAKTFNVQVQKTGSIVNLFFPKMELIEGPTKINEPVHFCSNIMSLNSGFNPGVDQGGSSVVFVNQEPAFASIHYNQPNGDATVIIKGKNQSMSSLNTIDAFKLSYKSDHSDISTHQWGLSFTD